MVLIEFSVVRFGWTFSFKIDYLVIQVIFVIGASMIVLAAHSDEPKHALSLVQYLRTIGYKAWVEDINGNEIEETALKMAIKSFCD